MKHKSKHFLIIFMAFFIPIVLVTAAFAKSVLTFKTKSNAINAKPAAPISSAPLSKDINGSDQSGAWNIRLLSSVTNVNSLGFTDATDMQLVGQRLYIKNRAKDPVYDVSDPYHPQKVFEIGVDEGFGRIFGANKVVGNLYYQVSFGPNLVTHLYVWDLNNGNPQYLGGFDNIPGGQSKDIDVKNGKAYILTSERRVEPSYLTGTLTILDVNNAGNIKILGSTTWGTHDDFGGTSNITVSDEGIAYVGTNGVKVFNVTDPANIIELTRFETEYIPSSKDDIQLVGGRIYVSNASLGISILDFGRPTYRPYVVNLIGSPLLSLGNPPSYLGDDSYHNASFQVVDNLLFVITSADRTLKIMNITDKRRPVVLSSYVLPVPGTNVHSTYKLRVDSLRRLIYVVNEVGYGAAAPLKPDSYWSTLNTFAYGKSIEKQAAK